MYVGPIASSIQGVAKKYNVNSSCMNSVAIMHTQTCSGVLQLVEDKVSYLSHVNGFPNC